MTLVDNVKMLKK